MFRKTFFLLSIFLFLSVAEISFAAAKGDGSMRRISPQNSPRCFALPRLALPPAAKVVGGDDSSEGQCTDFSVRSESPGTDCSGRSVSPTLLQILTGEVVLAKAVATGAGL